VRVRPHPTEPRSLPANDAERGEELRDAGLVAVAAAADPEWMEEALSAMYVAATELEHVTTDDVWKRMSGEVDTHEHRAMGAVVLKAQAQGWITATDRFIRTDRSIAHRQPKRVWRSLIYQTEVGIPDTRVAEKPEEMAEAVVELMDTEVLEMLHRAAIGVSRLRDRAGQNRRHYYAMSCPDHGWYLVSSGPHGIEGRSTWMGSCDTCGRAEMGDLVRELEMPPPEEREER
jgi:hypothetical protein